MNALRLHKTGEESAAAYSKITTEDFELIKKTALFTPEDVRYLKMSADVLKDQVEKVLDVWYDFVGSNPQLAASFSDKTTGRPDPRYLQAVRKRFGEWIMNTAQGEYDKDWLKYQYEIGLRHHRTKKNQTDGVHSTDTVPFRYLFALHYPITMTLKPFLASKGHSAEEVEKMHQAWTKSVLIQVILWSEPYVRSEDF